MIENYFKILRVKSDLFGFGRDGNMIKSHDVIRENLTIDDCSQNFFDLPSVTYYKVDNKLEFLDRDKFNFCADIFVGSKKLECTEVKSR